MRRLGLNHYPAGNKRFWEVDGSGLLVYREGRLPWRVKPSGYSRAAQAGYLERHPELKDEFSSRARAVDAVRLALEAEPFRLETRTRWEREAEGTYRSSCGGWRLRREEKIDRLTCLRSLTPAQLHALRVSAPGGEFMRSRSTLHMLSRVVDHLNQLTGEPSEPRPGRKRV